MKNIVEFKNLAEQLEKQIKTMDLPDHRKIIETKKDVLWLQNNIHTWNKEHKNLYSAKALISRLMEIK